MYPFCSGLAPCDRRYSSTNRSISRGVMPGLMRRANSRWQEANSRPERCIFSISALLLREMVKIKYPFPQYHYPLLWDERKGDDKKRSGFSPVFVTKMMERHNRRASVYGRGGCARGPLLVAARGFERIWVIALIFFRFVLPAIQDRVFQGTERPVLFFAPHGVYWM